jgi:hypothetical protein
VASTVDLALPAPLAAGLRTRVRIPTKPVTDSDLNPAICSDLKSARIPI